MKEIWAKCPKNKEVILIEKKILIFLKKFHLENKISIDEIETWIYNSKISNEKKIFDPILQSIKGGRLSDFMEFNDLFWNKLFPLVPQRVLNGLSPVKYALYLKKLKDMEN